MPRPISYAVFCLKKKSRHDNSRSRLAQRAPDPSPRPGPTARYAVLLWDHSACAPQTAPSFFVNGTPTSEFYTLSLHDALPIFFLISWFSLLLLQLLRHLFYRHLKLHRQRYILIV